MTATTESPKLAKKKKAKLNRYPFWCLRFWYGMRALDLWRLLTRNRFRVHPLRWGMVFMLTPAGIFNSCMYRIQQLLFSRRLARVKIDSGPIFIIGHWRTGTTHLHELICRDKQFAYPDTYDCFAPHHFLVTGGFMPKLLKLFLPAKRPMDNMAAGFDHPQEDEFALCVLGAPTPYFRMAFPNHTPAYQEFLNMEGTAKRDLERFKHDLLYFVRALTLKKKKPLVMKSPPHTGRIELLSEMFPNARFIHIVRNPYEVFPSSRRLWEALDRIQGFQVPQHDNLDEVIFESFERMYRGFDQQRENVDVSRLCEVRYEDLVQDPLGELERIYDHLQLGDFEQVRPEIEHYVEGQRAYQPNRHELDPELKSRIDSRWKSYMDRYGYSS